jgi:hypothetical protein
MNRPIVIYLGAYKNPLSYYIPYNESEHNMLRLGRQANKALLCKILSLDILTTCITRQK